MYINGIDFLSEVVVVHFFSSNISPLTELIINHCKELRAEILTRRYQMLVQDLHSTDPIDPTQGNMS